MKPKAALTTSALLAIFAVSLAGCASTPPETVIAAPQCTAPAPPANLPVIDRGALYDDVGDAEYRSIERYINRLWAYADEQAAILAVLCGEEA